MEKIVYLCQHPANILVAIVHKLKFHYNESAVLIFNPECNYVAKDPFFPKGLGIEYNNSLTVSDVKKWMECSNEEELAHISDELCQNIFDEEAIEPDICKVYFLYDWIPLFSYYFYKHNLHYSIIEIVAISYEKPFRDSKAFPAVLNSQIHFFGKGSYLCDEIVSSFCKDDLDIKITKFSVIDELLSFEPKMKDQIIDAYDVEPYINIMRNGIVILLNSFGAFGGYVRKYNTTTIFSDSDSEYHIFLFYMTLLDYLFPDEKVYVKLHPLSSDRLNNMFLKHKEFLPLNIPLEVVACKPDILNKLEFVTMLESTSANTITKVGGKGIVLGEVAMPFFMTAHFLYASISIIVAIFQDVSKKIKVVFCGVNKKLLNIFIERNFPSLNDSFIILDKVEEANIIIMNNQEGLFESIKNRVSSNSLLISNNLLFLDNNLSMRITVQNNEKGERSVFKDLMLNVYTQSNILFERIKKFAKSWMLKNSEMEVSIISEELLIRAQIYPILKIFIDKEELQTINLSGIKPSIISEMGSYLKEEFISLSENITTGEGIINIYNHFDNTKADKLYPDMEIKILTPILKQFWRNSIDAVINFDEMSWNTDTVFNNPKMNKMGIFVDVFISNTEKFLLKKNMLIYCKDVRLMDQLRGAIETYQIKLDNTFDITYKIRELEKKNQGIV